MRILHLSFHIGCIRSINTLMKALGHTVDYKYCYPEIPYTITETIADTLWDANKAVWNTYDLILTSDTVALSYIFLRHLDEMKPKLLIWICNFFSYGMGDVPDFFDRLRKISSSNTYGNKVKLIPYSEFERIRCGYEKIWIREPTLWPYGIVDPDAIQGRYNKVSSLHIDTSGSCNNDPTKTVFIAAYTNDTDFFPFKQFLQMNEISVATGDFRTVDELKQYMCIVTLPDAFCKMFYFELLCVGLPIFVPTENFFMKLNPCATPTGQYKFTYGGNVVPPQFVDMCVWYQHPEIITFFDSFEELIQKLREFTPEKRAAVQMKMKRAAEYHTQSVLSTARKILASYDS